MLKSKDFFDVKSLVKLSDLFNARVHLGHHEGCWNGHMKPYIYASRAHHHIIDLNKTVNHLQVGCYTWIECQFSCLFFLDTVFL